MSNPTVTVLVPAKNEVDGIVQVIDSLREYVDEIIVIDGHSNDGTAELARQAGAQVYLDNKRGKGDAYKVGIENAHGDIIVFFDADGSHCSSQIPDLIEPLVKNQADMVIASRYKGGSDEWEGDLSSYLRSVGSSFLAISINYIWNTNLTDVLNGFRAVRRHPAIMVELKADDFDIEQHMVVQFLRYQYRVIEVAGHEYCRQWGKSKLPTYRRAHLFFWRLFLDMGSCMKDRLTGYNNNKRTTQETRIVS